MLYVVDTPPLFGTAGQQANNDDGQVYGFTGFVSYPKIQDLQAIVELWAQYFGGIMGEWSQGADSAHTRWGFWFPYDASVNPNGTDSFQPARTFFDFSRMRELCYVRMPIGYSSQSMTHQGALFLDADPLSGYPDYCAQNNLFAGCDGSEGSVESLFGDCVGVGGKWYYNDSTTTGITRALPLKDACGTQPFNPNQLAVQEDLISLWRNVKNVANHYLYHLTPNATMFSNGSFGQPFDRAYNQPSTYVRQRRTRMTNSVFSSDDFDTGFQPYYSGYYNTTYTERHEWYRTAEDIDSDNYQYAWYALDDKVTKTNSDQWLWKNVPSPSELFGQNVPLKRDLLIVWKVEYRAGYRYSNQSSTTWTINYTG